MFVYTVKLFINKEQKSDFINYLHLKHLPDVVNTGCFLDYSLEVDVEKNELLARYKCQSQEIFDRYTKEFADEMRNDVIVKFPNAIIKGERNFCKIL